MGNYIFTSNGVLVSVDELYHHGIKGQKWGIRRYQNKDGSLTEAGKKRLDDYKAKESAEAIKRGNRHANKYTASAAEAKLERVKRITNAELKRIENMTFDEMRSEKMKSAIELGIYFTGIVAPLPLSDALAIAIVGDPFDNKTKRRTGESYNKIAFE